MTTPLLKGHCYCGKLSYQVAVPAPFPLSAYCHCSNCQRFNGSPFVHSLHVPYEWLRWTPTAEAPPPGTDVKLLTAEDAKRREARPEGAFPEGMRTLETMPQRKWKTRCSECGCPMGSWNAGTQRWTIWKTSIARKPAEGELNSKDPLRYTGPHDVDDRLAQWIIATHHQFYGEWRAMEITDDLEKWDGYKDRSRRVE